tara:strand:- start:3056 stop:3355 length:300 start_codon:yes stop_codon:yes gene_type:complete
MSASKRAFEEYATMWCDYENIDRPHNGYHSYPTMWDLRRLYESNIVSSVRNQLVLQNYNDGDYKCLVIGDLEGAEGRHLFTCHACHHGKPCEEKEGEEQ